MSAQRSNRHTAITFTLPEGTTAGAVYLPDPSIEPASYGGVTDQLKFVLGCPLLPALKLALEHVSTLAAGVVMVALPGPPVATLWPSPPHEATMNPNHAASECRARARPLFIPGPPRPGS